MNATLDATAILCFNQYGRGKRVQSQTIKKDNHMLKKNYTVLPVLFVYQGTKHPNIYFFQHAL
jgi:hypothetical protein